MRPEPLSKNPVVKIGRMANSEASFEEELNFVQFSFRVFFVMSMANSSINLFFSLEDLAGDGKVVFCFVFSNFNILKLRECTRFCLHL